MEVTEEVNRNRLGCTFRSFEDFDHYLDSWCILNGRSSHRLETKKSFRLQVCRYGSVVRPRWRCTIAGSSSR